MEEIVKAGRAAVLGLSLLSLAGATTETSAETDTSGAVSQGSDTLGVSPARERIFKEGIELGKKLGRIELSLEMIEKSVSLTDKNVSSSSNLELREDWALEKNKIAGNLKMIRDKINTGYLDTELAIGMLELMVKDIENWNKTLSAAVPAAGAAASARPAKPVKDGLFAGGFGPLFPDPASDPNINVMMTTDNYVALGIIKTVASVGLPYIKQNLPETQMKIREMGDLFPDHTQEEGYGPAFSRGLTREVTRGTKSMNEMAEEHRAAERARIEAERLKNQPR